MKKNIIILLILECRGKMKKFLKLFLLFMFVIITINLLFSETKFRVSGKVVNHDKGLAGIKVIFSGYKSREFYKTTTDSNGNFSIYLLPDKYSVYVGRQRGYYDSYGKKRIIEVKNRNIEGLVIEMIKSAKVCGKVITKDKKLRVKGSAHIKNIKSTPIFLNMWGGKIEKDGSFCIDYIRPYPGFVVIMLDGFVEEIKSGKIDIKEGANIKGVVIEVPEIERTISGKLIDKESGKILELMKEGIENFYIVIREKGEMLGKEVWFPLGFADVYEDGNFYFYNVKPGNYMLTINDRKEEYKYLRMPIIVEKGKKINLVLKMEKKRNKNEDS